MDKGNSFSNGNNFAFGPTGFRSWRSGWQAPPPVTLYDFTEGEQPR